MKILVRETGKTVDIEIHGVNESECTYAFFLEHFSDAEGIYETPDEEREMFSTDAEWTIDSGSVFDELAEVLSEYRKCIDEIRTQLIDYEIPAEGYVFGGKNFVM